jgi:phosphoglycolate phosphatase-like HAD superfamily hydrolase
MLWAGSGRWSWCKAPAISEPATTSSIGALSMHLVVFDIDGTLTNTNLEDGECYWTAVSEVLGLSGERPDWSTFRHVTDVGIAEELSVRHLRRQLTSVDVEAFGRRLTTLLEVALVDEDPRAYQIPGSAEILSILTKSFDSALALATGGLRASAELKLHRANLLNPFIPIASSNDAISREEIMRIEARRAAEKHATQFARFTYVGDGVWDAKAARDLGWRFIGIGSGEQADRLRQAGAEIVIPDYRPAEAFLGLLVDKGESQTL